MNKGQVAVKRTDKIYCYDYNSHEFICCYKNIPIAARKMNLHYKSIWDVLDKTNKKGRRKHIFHSVTFKFVYLTTEKIN